MVSLQSATRTLKVLRDFGATIPSYGAIAGVVLDATLERDGVDRAVATVMALQDEARTIELPAIVRYLAGECVTVLVVKGGIGNAEEVWRVVGLPERAAE